MDQIVDAVIKYWATFGCGIVVTVLIACRKKIVEIIKDKQRKRDALEYSNRYVLFLKLKELYKESEAQGYVTVDDLDEAIDTYNHYHNLGGNGKATIMIDAMRDMDVHSD